MVTRTTRVVDPNVTPMIDVLLVLLIVFMLMIEGKKAMAVQLPEECKSACVAGDAIVLEVFPGGAYRLNQRAVDRSSLRHVLANVYSGRPDKVLSVAGRPGARYRDVVEAMDVARKAGVRVISIVPKGM